MINIETFFIIPENVYTEQLKDIQVQNVKHNLKINALNKYGKRPKRYKIFIRRNCLYRNIHNDRLQFIEELNFANKEYFVPAPYVYVGVVAEIEGDEKC